MSKEKLSLDGQWQIALDPRNVGKEEQWFAEDVSGPKFQEIKAPSCWEEKFPFYDGVGWYRREFDAPEDWEGKRIHLTFWAVNYFAEVWVNGQCAGSHEGGYSPFTLELSSLLRCGKSNTLCVRVVNAPKRGTVTKAAFVDYLAGETTEEAAEEGIDAFVLDEVPKRSALIWAKTRWPIGYF